jgi:hypothetical protein
MKMDKAYVECAIATALPENICLCNPLYSEECRKELKEINKHELIIKICEILGPCPTNLCKAEEIFDSMKYDIANYVVHHEYVSDKGINTELLLWLDSKTNPRVIKRLNSFFKKYLK